MAKIQKDFQFTQRILTAAETNGKKSISLVGELTVSGVGYYDGSQYDFDLNHVMFTPDQRGMYASCSVDVLELLMYMGINPKEDERILYPTMSHLEFLFNPETALQLSNILIDADMAGAIDLPLIAYENQQL